MSEADPTDEADIREALDRIATETEWTSLDDLARECGLDQPDDRPYGLTTRKPLRNLQWMLDNSVTMTDGD